MTENTFSADPYNWLLRQLSRKLKFVNQVNQFERTAYEKCFCPILFDEQFSRVHASLESYIFIINLQQDKQKLSYNLQNCGCYFEFPHTHDEF